MRKTVGVFFTMLAAALFLAPLAAPPEAFSQELKVAGEVKTGFYMGTEKIGNLAPRVQEGMTNNDGDSGVGEGQIRLDFRFTYEDMGLRIRFQTDPQGLGPFLPTWNFAYAYGKLLNQQLTISAGLLGESPWGTGGPELRCEPETRVYTVYNQLSGDPYDAVEGLMGIRVEYKPSFIPGLNVGFVLNQCDQVAIDIQKQTIGDVLAESVIGLAYENEYFAARAGYRFDGKGDKYKNNNMNEGSRLSYRLEERILNQIVPGMQIWLNGYYYGIGCEQQEIDKMINGSLVKAKMGVGEYFINWLYWRWNTDSYIAKFDTCFSAYQSYNNAEFQPIERQEYQSLEFKPAFYCKFFNNLFQAGAALGFGMEFGPGKTYINSPWQYISVEPQARLNIGSNAYLALLYNFTDSYAWPTDNSIQRGDMSKKHWINLRAVYSF